MTLISMEQIDYRYPGGKQILHQVSLQLQTGVNLGVLGESGSGKSTLLRLMLGLARPDSGTIHIEGQPFDARNRQQMVAHRRLVQPVFQDPYTSLDPRMRVDRIIAEPFHALGLTGDLQVETARVLDAVGLPQDALTRYPRAFSGGQRQRIAIARAMIARPKILLADEPVSALDLSTKVRVVDLLASVAQSCTLVMVSHDIAVVAALCPQLVVLQHGRVVEAGATKDILAAPQHPYTQALLDSLPRLPHFASNSGE